MNKIRCSDIYWRDKTTNNLILTLETKCIVFFHTSRLERWIKINDSCITECYQQYRQCATIIWTVLMWEWLSYYDCATWLYSVHCLVWNSVNPDIPLYKHGRKELQKKKRSDSTDGIAQLGINSTQVFDGVNTSAKRSESLFEKETLRYRKFSSAS